MTAISKKIVHYDLEQGAIVFEYGAILNPVDHPDSANVSNTKEVFTSKVLSYDPESGRIETENTIYIPYEETQH